MNALTSLYRLFPTSLVATVPATPAKAIPAAPPALAEPAPALRPDRYRRRDYGTGYGRSSGYAQDRSYASASSHRLVRVG